VAAADSSVASAVDGQSFVEQVSKAIEATVVRVLRPDLHSFHAQPACAVSNEVRVFSATRCNVA